MTWLMPFVGLPFLMVQSGHTNTTSSSILASINIAGAMSRVLVGYWVASIPSLKDRTLLVTAGGLVIGGLACIGFGASASAVQLCICGAIYGAATYPMLSLIPNNILSVLPKNLLAHGIGIYETFCFGIMGLPSGAIIGSVFDWTQSCSVVFGIMSFLFVISSCLFAFTQWLKS